MYVAVTPQSLARISARLARERGEEVQELGGDDGLDEVPVLRKYSNCAPVSSRFRCNSGRRLDCVADGDADD